MSGPLIWECVGEDVWLDLITVSPAASVSSVQPRVASRFGEHGRGTGLTSAVMKLRVVPPQNGPSAPRTGGSEWQRKEITILRLKEVPRSQCDRRDAFGEARRAVHIF